MSELKIVKIGDPVLRKRAVKVNNFGPELQRLIDDMAETMAAAKGVGLAAPQVGRGLRVFVARLDEDPEGDGLMDPNLGKLHVVINPEIKRASDEMVEGVEGCLSIPGYVGDVMRHEAITMEYQDRRGTKKRIKLKGWLARVFQHEFDHLNGVLFVDRTEKIYEVTEGEEENTEGAPHGEPSSPAPAEG